MNEQDLFSCLNDDVIAQFKRAIELGKWSDGKKLTQQQKETCMQAVILYEHSNADETQRTGYVPPKPDPCGDTGDVPETIKWK